MNVEKFFIKIIERNVDDMQNATVGTHLSLRLEASQRRRYAGCKDEMLCKIN
jgi:hypothetical protein